MKYALVAAVLLLSLFVTADSLAGCYECSVHDGYASCEYMEDVNAGLWADCEGGQMCYSMPGAGGGSCMPYCGTSRCYLI